MSTRSLSALLFAAVLAATAAAQTSIWTPNGYAATVGNSNNIFPWGRNASAIHYMQIYGAANFTAQSVNTSVAISRLRFRTWSTSASWSGGSWPNVVLNMSTAALPYNGASATFASNHGANLTNVYTGTVTVMPGTGLGTGVPGPVYIDIPLATPFLYDPNMGDLCFEVELPGVGWSGASQPCDAVSGSIAQMTRIYELTSATSTIGNVGMNYGLVTEFTYVPAGGNASQTPYGTGCYGLALAASARPLLGTTINLVTTGIPSGTLLGATVFSNARHNPGLDLTSIGMAGCRQYVDLDVTRVMLTSGPSASVPQSIPYDPSFIGVQVNCQSATFSPGFNPLGLIASNGITLVLGTL